MGGAGPSPRCWHFTEHRQLSWVFVPSAAILLLLAATWLGSTWFGDGAGGDDLGSSADWTTPAVALSLIAAVPLVVGGLLALGERCFERRLARRSVATAVAVWPQYATDRQWRREAERRADDAATADWLPWAIGVPAVLIGALAVWASLAGVAVAVPPLLACWLLIVGLALGRRWRLTAGIARDRRRRELLAPTPLAWVSPEGVYDEDVGLIRIDQITDVRVVDDDDLAAHRKRLRSVRATTDLTGLDTRLASTGWRLLAITVDTGVARTLGRKFFEHFRRLRSYGPPIEIVHHVRVPPGRDGEAHTAAAAITRRWSI